MVRCNPETYVSMNENVLRTFQRTSHECARAHTHRIGMQCSLCTKKYVQALHSIKDASSNLASAKYTFLPHETSTRNCGASSRPMKMGDAEFIDTVNFYKVRSGRGFSKDSGVPPGGVCTRIV